MMVCGAMLGICTITVGYFIAVWLNKKMPIPLRDAPDARLEDIAAIANKPDKELPSLGWALLPAAFPLVTICFHSFVETFAKHNTALTDSVVLNKILGVILFFGDKNIAMLMGGIFALIVLAKQKKTTREKLTAFVQTALMTWGRYYFNYCSRWCIWWHVTTIRHKPKYCSCYQRLSNGIDPPGIFNYCNCSYSTRLSDCCLNHSFWYIGWHGTK
jgi:H+/gluconate symporter-like permease